MDSAGQGTRTRPGEGRFDRPEHDVRAAELLAELTGMVGGRADLKTALDAAARRSLELLDARALGLALVEGNEFVVAARAGEQELFPFERAPVGAGRRALAAIAADRAVRLDPSSQDGPPPLRGRAVMLAPMRFAGRTVGVLTAIERNPPGRTFEADDEPLAEALAAAVATVVAVSRSASDEALRRSVATAERERARWAHELHDDALQSLAAIRLMVGQVRRSAREHDDVLEAVDDLLGEQMTRLRDLVHDLRPTVLDELGVQPAVEAAAARFERRAGVPVEVDVDLAYEQQREATRLAGDLESAVYFVTSEALNDAARRGLAHTISVAIRELGSRVLVDVEHDDPTLEDERLLADLSLRERAALVGGTVTVDRRGGRTAIHAEFPARRRDA